MSKTRQNAISDKDRLHTLEQEALAFRNDLEASRDKIADLKKQLAATPDFAAALDAAIHQFSERLAVLERKVDTELIANQTRAAVAKIMREEQAKEQAK